MSGKGWKSDFGLLSRLGLVGSIVFGALTSCGVGIGPRTLAQATGTSAVAATAMQPQDPPAAGAEFYYYAKGGRVPLTLSLDWISVKFANSDPSVQMAALERLGAPVGPIDQGRYLPDRGLTLVPVQKGVTAERVAETIRILRAQPTDFPLVSPVFQSSDSLMLITDQFIASFPASQGMAEIDALNGAHRVAIVEPILGQANTFVLQVLPGEGLDALGMANLYQESGLAIDAAPNFTRIARQAP